jgi:hypothetical protein
MAGFPSGTTFQAGGKPSIHHPSRAICEDVLVNCQGGNRHSVQWHGARLLAWLMTRDIQGILESWPKKTAPKTLGTVGMATFKPTDWREQYCARWGW